MNLLKDTDNEKDSLLLASIKNPRKYAQKSLTLDSSPVYAKLLAMYERVKDQEENHIEMFIKGETVLVSPKMMYLHLRYQTPFAQHITALAEAMEQEVLV